MSTLDRRRLIQAGAAFSAGSIFGALMNFKWVAQHEG